jgi:hypothetical protein
MLCHGKCELACHWSHDWLCVRCAEIALGGAFAAVTGPLWQVRSWLQKCPTRMRSFVNTASVDVLLFLIPCHTADGNQLLCECMLSCFATGVSEKCCSAMFVVLNRPSAVCACMHAQAYRADRYFSEPIVLLRRTRESRILRFGVTVTCLS